MGLVLRGCRTLKITIKEVEEFLKDNFSDWILKSTTYVNLDTPLILECPFGHTVEYSFKQLRRKKKLECITCNSQPKKKYQIHDLPVKAGERLLSLDNSTRITGWAVFENDNLLRYGHFNCKDDNYHERISKTKYLIASLIENFEIDFVVLEDIQLQESKDGVMFEVNKGIVTFKQLASLQGVLVNYFFENNIKYLLLYCSTWRSILGITGKHSSILKTKAKQKVFNLYGIDVLTDEADAICIGWAYINKERQKKALENVKCF